VFYLHAGLEEALFGESDKTFLELLHGDDKEAGNWMENPDSSQQVFLFAKSPVH